MKTYCITHVSKDQNGNIIKVRGYRIFGSSIHSFEQDSNTLASEIANNSNEVKALTAKIIIISEDGVKQYEKTIANPNSEISGILNKDGSYFLRTSANCKKEDNLDNLPLF